MNKKKRRRRRRRRKKERKENKHARGSSLVRKLPSQPSRKRFLDAMPCQSKPKKMPPGCMYEKSEQRRKKKKCPRKGF
jgi:hypothetical protein